MTYYEVLNIKKTATEKEIKNAYRALAKKYHPDTYKGNKNMAEEKMKQINEAYDVLSNKDLKAKYDEQFTSPITETKREDSYSKGYYNYETYEYKSPDPRDADYRNYYNYSPEYEYEPEYDFSKLKALFQGSALKIVFVAIGIISILCFLGYMINEIRIQALSIFEQVDTVEPEIKGENIPEQVYVDKPNNTIPNMPEPEKVTPQVEYPEFDNAEIEEKLKEWEESINKWYETEGKEYEAQIKNDLESWYQKLVEAANNN